MKRHRGAISKQCFAAALAIAFLAGALGLSAHEAHKHGAGQKGHAGAGQALTFQGEVLDMVCYMAHEGKGAKHKKCAKMCLVGGAPTGLLTADGQVYLLVEDHDNKEPYAKLKNFAAEQVRVKGRVFKRGGVQAIVVEEVQKV